jgi:hypothetical protein
VDEDNVATLAEAIDSERVAMLNDEPPAAARNRGELFARAAPNSPLVLESPAALGLRGASDTAIAHLAQLGWNRWRYVSGTNFLRDAIAVANSGRSANPPMEIAVLGILALFSTPAGTLAISSSGRTVADSIGANYVLKLPWQAQAKDWDIIRKLLEVAVDPEFDWNIYVRRISR